MTKLEYFEEAAPVWADSGLSVCRGERQIVSVYIKRINFCRNRYYLGMILRDAPTRAELLTMKKEFERCTKGFELESIVHKDDVKAQRFIAFLGFSPMSPTTVDDHYIYERIS